MLPGWNPVFTHALTHTVHMHSDQEHTQTYIHTYKQNHQIRASPVAQWQRTHLQCRSHRRLGFDPLGSGRSPRGEHGNTLQYSCLESPMDRGAWWVTVPRVAKNQTQLKLLSIHAREKSYLSTLTYTTLAHMCIYRHTPEHTHDHGYTCLCLVLNTQQHTQRCTRTNAQGTDHNSSTPVHVQSQGCTHIARAHVCKCTNIHPGTHTLAHKYPATLKRCSESPDEEGVLL